MTDKQPVSLPNPENVERLFAEMERVLSGQPAVDVYNVLINTLGHTLNQSGHPPSMLMQTIQVLAVIVGVPVERIELVNEESDEEEGEPDGAHIATH